MMHVCTNIQRYMRVIDIEAFRKEAAAQRSYILVRRPNPASRKFIGLPGFSPKPFDCKFKTAQQDFYHIRLGKWIRAGGLVVNPALDEFEKAFTNKSSFAAALKCWKQHSANVLTIESQNPDDLRFMHLLPSSKQYRVDMDPRSPYYGCVMLNRQSYTIQTTLLHADYDVYAILPTSHPKTFQQLLNELYEKPQYRGVNFFDYQHRLNRAMGVPMIQHAPQELTGPYIDDQVFVFMPDSPTVFLLPNQLEIRDFYQTMLGGRQLVNY